MNERVEDAKEIFSGAGGLQPTELLELALRKKVEGNGLFKEKEYHLAVESYSKAIEICPKEQKYEENLVGTSF